MQDRASTHRPEKKLNPLCPAPSKLQCNTEDVGNDIVPTYTDPVLIYIHFAKTLTRRHCIADERGSRHELHVTSEKC